MLNGERYMPEPEDDGNEILSTALQLEPLRRTRMPVAPFMEDVFGYYGGRRYVAFTSVRPRLVYWTDGIEDGYSVLAIWDRFLRHPLVSPHLEDCRFKSRLVKPEELTMFESPAEALRVELEEMGDGILLDRENRTVWTGLFARVLLHLTFAIAREDIPPNEQEDAPDNLQIVDHALQKEFLEWLDDRLNVGSTLYALKCRQRRQVLGSSNYLSTLESGLRVSTLRRFEVS
jgi:hypothetical protein